MLDILITHKNRNHLLRELLTSIRYNLSKISHNIIIVDDASDIIPAESSISKYCGSSAKAKAEAIKLSSADFFMFVDSDDLILPNSDSIISHNFNNSIVTSFRYQPNIHDNRKTNKTIVVPIDQLYRKHIRYPAIICRNAYDFIGGINTELPYCADMDLYYRLYLEYADRCKYVDKPILLKRKFSDSIGVKYHDDQLKTFIEVQNKYKQLYM